MGRRDVNKRLKGFGIPIEVCVKYERRAGLKTGEVADKKTQELIASYMVQDLIAAVANVPLSSEDYALIAKEVKANENK